MDITGLILAGGRGTRMGTVDKGLVALAGKPNQVEAARSILDQARRDLYRLLADDE